MKRKERSHGNGPSSETGKRLKAAFKKAKYTVNSRPITIRATFKGNTDAAQNRYTQTVPGESELLADALEFGYSKLNKNQRLRVQRQLLNLYTIVKPGSVRSEKQFTISFTPEEWNKWLAEGEKDNTEIYNVIKYILNRRVSDPEILRVAIQNHVHWWRNLKHLKEQNGDKLHGYKTMIEHFDYKAPTINKFKTSLDDLSNIFKKVEKDLENHSVNFINMASEQLQIPMVKTHFVAKEVLGADGKPQTVYVLENLLAGAVQRTAEELSEHTFSESEGKLANELLADELKEKIQEQTEKITGSLEPQAVLPPPSSEDVSINLEGLEAPDFDPPFAKNLKDIEPGKEALDVLQISELKLQELNKLKADYKEIKEHVELLKNSPNPFTGNLAVDAELALENLDKLIQQKSLEFNYDWGGLDLKHPPAATPDPFSPSTEPEVKNIPSAAQLQPTSTINVLPPAITQNLYTEIKQNLPAPLPPISTLPPPVTTLPSSIPTSTADQVPTFIIPKTKVEEVNQELIRLGKVKEIVCAPTPSEGQVIAVKAILGCK